MLHHCGKAWALTPRFHPYPPEADGLFSVALAVPQALCRKTFPLGSMALCVVLTFLTVLLKIRNTVRQNGLSPLQR
jgi:hypothetical protein